MSEPDLLPPQTKRWQLRRQSKNAPLRESLGILSSQAPVKGFTLLCQVQFMKEGERAVHRRDGDEHVDCGGRKQQREARHVSLFPCGLPEGHSPHDASWDLGNG